MPSSAPSLGFLKSRPVKGGLSWFWVHNETVVVDGKGKRKSVWTHLLGARTEPEAKRMMIVKIGDKTPATPETVTFGQVAEAYKDADVLDYEITTRARYESNINFHLIPAFGARRVSDITVGEVETFLRGLAAKGYKKPTIQGVHGQFKSIVAYGLRTEMLNTAERLERARAPKVADSPARKGRPAPEIKKLLERLRAAASWLYAPIYLCAVLGARIGEVLGLTWGDVDLDGGVVTIRRAAKHVHYRQQAYVYDGRPKSAAGERRIAIGAGVVQFLRALREYREIELGRPVGPADAVIVRDGGRPSYSMVEAAWRRFRTKYPAAVGDMRIHDLRHCNASWLDAEGYGGSVAQERLGHVRPETTVRYTHGMPENHRKAADAIDKLLQ